MKQFFFSLIISVLFFSCNVRLTKEQLATEVRTSINEELQKEALKNGIKITVKSFDLLHKGGNEYSGILNTTEGEEEYTYEVDVKYDGDTFIWKILE